MTRLAILCSGQGGQHQGMFEKLCRDPLAAGVVQEAATLFGWDPTAIATAGAPGELFHNRTAQRLICVYTLAVWAAVRERLPAPIIFSGYSVGELAAYGCAGTWGIGDTLRLIDARAAAMDAACPTPSGLVAVLGLDRKQIDRLAKQHRVEVAIVNGFEHFVVGGGATDVEAAAVAANAMGARTQRLPVTVAAHTSGLQRATEEFRTALAAVTFSAPTAPVVCGITGDLIQSTSAALPALARQLSTPIDWSACMQAIYEFGVEACLELGPGASLAKMMHDRYPEVAVRSIDEFRDFDGVQAWIARMGGTHSES